MIILKIVAFVFLGGCSVLLGLSVMRWLLVWRKSGNRAATKYLLWCCRCMDWHSRPRAAGFDGCSATGCCPVCGRRVLLDSQGNWFACTQNPGYQEPAP